MECDVGQKAQNFGRFLLLALVEKKTAQHVVGCWVERSLLHLSLALFDWLDLA